MANMQIQIQLPTDKYKLGREDNDAEPGWQMLRERRSGAPRKVRVFYERKDPQHTLSCRET